MSFDEETGQWVDWEPSTPPSTPPPDQAIAWVEHNLGRRVDGFTKLEGGLSSAVHRLVLDDGSHVVLRRYTLADWIEREPYIPHDEARILRFLDSVELGVAVPRLLASDPGGIECDVPATLMSEVPGRPFIDPDDPLPWAERQAECLAQIHAQTPNPGLGVYRRWDDPNRPLPIWTQEPDAWRDAITLAAGDLPTHPETFLHRDFHPNNMHWTDGELVALVDWLSACRGPVAGDLSHNRWNLAVLTEPGVAEHFTNHYRSITGYSEDVVPFDLATILSGPVGPFPTHAWNALGRSDLRSDTVAVKIDAWLLHVLARMS